jgi:hypothetical protein
MKNNYDQTEYYFESILAFYYSSYKRSKSPQNTCFEGFLSVYTEGSPFCKIVLFSIHD